MRDGCFIEAVVFKKKENVTNGSQVFLFFIFDVLKNSYLGGE